MKASRSLWMALGSLRSSVKLENKNWIGELALWSHTLEALGSPPYDSFSKMTYGTCYKPGVFSIFFLSLLIETEN